MKRLLVLVTVLGFFGLAGFTAETGHAELPPVHKASAGFTTLELPPVH